MELIDRQALKAEMEKARDWCMSHDDPNGFFFFGGVVIQLSQAPTIDLVHAAGGCYCRECEFSDDCDKQATLRAYDPILELHKPSYHRITWCSYGKPRKRTLPKGGI